MTAKEKKKLPRLSATKLKLYEKCPTQYKWRYILNNKDTQNIYAVLGSAVHKAIQDKFTYPEKDIIYLFQQSYAKWVTPDIDQFNKARELYLQACTWLEEFDHEQFVPHNDSGKLALEKHFRIPYSINGEEVCTLEGYIDFIGNDNSMYAVDWKTGAEVYSNKKVENDLQFIVYEWAIEQMYGQKPEHIIYYRLRSNKAYIGKTFDRSRLDAIISQILQDPMQYEPVICGDCPSYCGVKKYFMSQVFEPE